MHTTSVPLDTLTISPANVRRADASIDDLVASIAAHGLLNPLTVVAEGDGFQVIAGGRRLRALQQLKIDPVPVVLVASDAGGELSLTENMSRVAMSTLDTLRALRRITDAREDPAYIAERFGIPMDRARKIARLSVLHDYILEAWEAGEIDQSHAEAFASTADTVLQRTALERFRETEASWERSPQRIRNWLGMGDYDARRLLAFVGRDAYEAAGGVIETDLFGEGERICNPELLQELGDKRRAAVFDEVQAQTNRPLELVAERPDNYWSNIVRPDAGDLPPEQEARIVELDALIQQLDEEDDDEARAKLDQCYDERDKLEDSRPIVLPEGGRIACYLTENGEPCFFWLQHPDAPEAPAAGEAEAEPEEAGIVPSAKAEQTMNDMRRARLIERSAASATMADAAHQLLLFTVARTCFGAAYDHTTAGLNKVHDRDVAERLTFVNITDEAKAWATFRKAFNTDAKRNKLAAEIVARLTAATAAPDKPHIALLTQHSQPMTWQSTEEFWSLWRKGQMLDLVREFDPAGEIITMLSGQTQGEMRRLLHDLFTDRKTCWKHIEPETLAAVQAWVPQWLRFTDEQPPEPAPGTMTDDEVAAQEAFVSAALDEGIDEFTEADEVAEAAE